MNKNIFWSGCWEQRESRTICRWMVTWFSREDKIYGAVAGYSGGGCFQLERFFIKNQQISIEAENSIPYETEGDQVATELCVDDILHRHAEKPWYESETLYLADFKILEQIKDKDIFIMGDKMPKVFLKLFENTGLVTKPNEDCFQ